MARALSKTMKVEEAAKLLSIGRNQAYDGVARGEIPHVRIGKRTRIVNDHGWDEIGDSTTFTVRDGVAIVPKDAIVPDGWQPDPGLHPVK